MRTLLYLHKDIRRKVHRQDYLLINLITESHPLQGKVDFPLTFISRKEATAIRYFGDGTGRDSYVVAESGGLIPPFKAASSQNTFYKSLRKSPRLAIKSGPYAKMNRYMNTWMTPKVKELMK
jgi:hypothetical protein